MPTLREIQRGFRDSLLDSGREAIAGAIAGDEIAAIDRLCIHRNTMRSVLTGSLRLSYPAVDRLVGGDFFDMAAARFIRTHPPVSGCLDDYGEAFAAFLQAMPETAGLPYLGDVARYEWALTRAAHAEDRAALDLMALGDIAPALHDGLRFMPHPSVSLLDLDYPADAIADAVMAGADDAMAGIAVSSGPVRLVVDRAGDGVRSERLEADAFRFLQALFGGQTLGALAAWGDSDVARYLAEQLTKGRLAGFTTEPAASLSGSLS